MQHKQGKAVLDVNQELAGRGMALIDDDCRDKRQILELKKNSVNGITVQNERRQ